MDCKISGIILSGGKNTRMNGKNKAFLKNHDQTFINIIADSLRDFTKEIIIISNSDLDIYPKEFKVYKDIIDKKTPLSGIHSGLSNIENDYGFVLACDLPFINKDVVKLMVDELEDGFDVITPSEGTFFQPLFSIYSKKNIPYIEKLLMDCEVKVDKLFDLIKLKKVAYDKIRKKDRNLKSFININSPKDLTNYINLEKN